MVSDKKFFYMFLPTNVYVKHVTPGVRPFLAPGV